MKGQSGITLVALVITVIVMLILAGVAISALTTDGDLFSKSSDAVDKYNAKVTEQDEKINNLVDQFDYYYGIYNEAH